MDTRTYGDRCGVARALDVIGERWALLVVRELLFGPKRFTDLLRGLDGISQNVLSQRLRGLERTGVVRRERLGPPARVTVYALTAEGAALKPVLIELGRWGRHRAPPEDAGFSVDAFVLALETTFDPDAAGDLAAVVDLHVGDDHVTLTVADGTLQAARGDASAADATLAVPDLPAARDLAFGPARLRDSVSSGTATLHGDRAAAQRLLDAFPVIPTPDGGGRPDPHPSRQQPS